MTVVVEPVCSTLLCCFRLLQFTSQFGRWSLRLRRNNAALCEALDNLESSLNNTHKGGTFVTLYVARCGMCQMGLGRGGRQRGERMGGREGVNTENDKRKEIIEMEQIERGGRERNGERDIGIGRQECIEGGEYKRGMTKLGGEGDKERMGIKCGSEWKSEGEYIIKLYLIFWPHHHSLMNNHTFYTTL